ncbi:stage II sporulation protein M [Chloroflexus sp.]|uniref:stage II sporulation protein M n=1 Tax=Chloroflexus sp. TaxID=1904827 RepID=UPI00298F2911|nr:stage II sporulation protein M [Chloroflexus sp.]MDW8402664.1 stage II sporulation protein M [Chloroflexus sp.]
MTTPDRQIRQRHSAWERLEELITLASSGIGRLSAAELRELGQLYRQACTDLAIARRDYPDHTLTLYLNQLVARAHGVIYRYSAAEPNRVLTFFRFTLPRTFRATWPMTLIAALVFLVPAMVSFFAAFRDPTLGETFVPGMSFIVEQIRNGEEWWLRINEGPAAASAEIMTNNINVAIRAFAGGVTLGVYTLYILLMNGLLLGTVAGIAQRFDFAANLWGFVAGHATLELSAIFIAGGAGLQLGWAILRPGTLSRRGALVVAARRAVVLLIGCALILVAAGLIEAFISPTSLPLALKLVVSFGSGALLYAYLLLSGRDQE